MRIFRIHKDNPNHTDAVTQRNDRRKRGSVLVLVVGVLAVLAVMALSYVTVVRIDRRSTDAYQKDENLQQQVTAATAYIQALLTADLFDNQIVNANTPRFVGSDIPNFPRAFADGEYSDAPWTDVDPNNPGNTRTGAVYTWDKSVIRPNDLTPQLSPDAKLDPARQDPSIDRARAFADDAWLAPTEPIDTGSQLNDGAEWDTWPQITNLRSAYRWRDTANYLGWARDSGRFVDLGQFLLQRAPNTPAGSPRPAFPGAFLELDKNQNNLWTDPNPDLVNSENGPNLGVNQKVFDLTMADLQEEFYPPSGFSDPGQGNRDFQPADERFWADTDGDGRPDARWQQLPILGNAFGMRWVIAAHITDNSALANLNSHMSFGYQPPSLGTNMLTDAQRFGDGRTPADVDLFRLIASQEKDAKAFDPANPVDPATGAPGSMTHPDIRDNGAGPFDALRLIASWKNHLDNGARVPDILKQIDVLNASNPGDQLRLNSGSVNFVTLSEPTGWPGQGGSNVGLYDGLGANPLELRRVERAAIWRYFGSNPRGATASSGVPYPISDEIDLRAHNGYNLLRFLSRAEQRLDGPIPNNSNDDGFLPGLTPPYADSNGPALGPMRSKEWDNRSDSPRTFNDSFILEPTYTNQQKLERLRKDIRHLLTTVSGEGPIGPVPVLNPALEFNNDPSTRKVDLRRFATPDLTVTPDRVRRPLQDTFDALVWALAPLATNQPLMAPLDQIDQNTYAALARDADLHYGGGKAGPASKTAKDQYGLSENTPGADDIGASYALLRAASLAVNTADAIDAQTKPGEATVEQPTIVRLFNQPDLDYFLAQNPTLLTNLNSSQTIPLGVRFPQGDIWDNPNVSPDNNINGVPTDRNLKALPEEVVGAPKNGVTLVGLDRQPFLVQAESLVVYANMNANENAPFPGDSDLDPDDPTDILGSFFAVELGNPWPEPLLINGYSVRIEDGATQLILDFDAATIAGGAIIPAGERVVFYFFSDVSQGASPGGGNAWKDVQDAIRAEFVDDGTNTREITAGLSGSAMSSGSADIFHAFGGASLPVLLVRTLRQGDPAASPPVLPIEILVDRLTPPTNPPTNPPNGEMFPATLPEPLELATVGGTGPIGGGRLAGRAAVQASLRRPTDPGSTGGGFPAYVIERPGNNVDNTQESGDVVHTWTVGNNGDPPRPLSEITDQITGLGELNLLAKPKPNDGADPVDPPAFELFVPNTPLISTAELGLVSTFTHMYIHADQQPPNVNDAWDTSGNLGPGKWATISEQLGWDAHYLYNNDPNNAPAGDNLNPYLGVLDLSRFILGVGGDIDAASTSVGNRLPDALAVPLASRVFEAFEAIPTPNNSSGVVRGRINVNTAPRRILELLPLVDPRDPITGLPFDIAGWTPTLTPGDTRVDWLERYRRRDNEPPGNANIVTNDADPTAGGLPAATNRLGNYTQLSGLRTPGANAPWSTGLTTKGELATMGRWSDPTAAVIDSTSPAFLELGANGQPNDQIPLDVRPLTTGFDAQDDPEERLAIFRAIANIVSTRSDIFTAWYILRAYDPKDIEAITIPPEIQNDDNRVVALMNPGNPQGLPGVSGDNPGLLPAFEQRMLVIFDRSNVRLPTDRPRILLQVELPLN